MFKLAIKKSFLHSLFTSFLKFLLPLVMMCFKICITAFHKKNDKTKNNSESNRINFFFCVFNDTSAHDQNPFFRVL